MREVPAGWAWFCRQPLHAQDEAARRHAVLEFVRAQWGCGWTVHAAVFSASGMFGVSVSSIWNWLRLTDGVVNNDRLAQLVALCPRRGGAGVRRRKWRR